MTLKDISNGPDWIMWVAFVILALMSIVLLTGRGAGLIAGYNTASKSEKSKYDEKKLCRVTGAGMSVITVLVLVIIPQTVDSSYFPFKKIWYPCIIDGVSSYSTTSLPI